MSRPARPARAGATLVGLVLAAGVTAPLGAAPALADDQPGRALVRGSCLGTGEQPLVEDPRSASHGMPHHDQALSAAADAYAQTAQVFVNADWDGGTVDGRTGESCGMQAEFSNVLHVGAGTTGKDVGDAVTLLATVDFDAVLDELGNSYEKQITSWSLVGGYTIIDPTVGGPPLGRFISSASRSVDTMPANWYDANGSWTWRSARGLAVQDNNGQDLRENTSDDGDICAGFPCDILLEPDVPFVLDPFELPTEPVTLVVHTKVGAALDVSGAVSLRASAYDGAVSSYGDALEGLDVDLAPAAGSEGLQLTLGDDAPPPPPDTTAPVVTATPSSAPNAAGWHQDAVTVQLEATDDGSGVATLSYGVDGEWQTVEGGSATIPVDDEGTTTITYSASDDVGNVSPDQTLVVELDRTTPTLHLPSGITVAATGPAGAVVDHTHAATDDLSGVTSSACTPAAGSTFPVGTTTVTCTAADAAGNTSTASFPVTVTEPTPAERVDALEAVLASVSGPTSATAPLHNELRQVERALTATKHAQACQHLGQFADLADKRSGKQLSVADATRLADDARAIRTAMGC